MGILSLVLDNARISAPKKSRSSKWAKVRDSFIKKNPRCACCGQETKLEVHHIVPFDNNPELELDENNLIVLCETAKGGIICHLFCGHNSNYKDYNPNVVKDAQYINDMLKNKLT